MTTDPTWRTSSYSGGQGNCIEVGDHGSRVLVRDTQDRTGPVLQFTPGAWSRFADRLKAQRPLGGCARERDPASWLGCYVKRWAGSPLSAALGLCSIVYCPAGLIPVAGRPIRLAVPPEAILTQALTEQERSQQAQ